MPRAFQWKGKDESIFERLEGAERERGRRGQQAGGGKREGGRGKERRTQQAGGGREREGEGRREERGREREGGKREGRQRREEGGKREGVHQFQVSRRRRSGRVSASRFRWAEGVGEVEAAGGREERGREREGEGRERKGGRGGIAAGGGRGKRKGGRGCAAGKVARVSASRCAVDGDGEEGGFRRGRKGEERERGGHAGVLISPARERIECDGGWDMLTALSIPMLLKPDRLTN